MNLLIAGGDARFAFAAEEGTRRGLRVTVLGLEKAGGRFRRGRLSDAAEADAVILANPWRGQLPGPMDQSGVAADRLLDNLNPGAKLFLPDDTAKPASFARPYIKPDEAYLLANARLTAEGAVSALMARSDFALAGERALVIGWGRIAKSLCPLLRGLGANVCAAARRAQAREEAHAAGYLTCGMDEISTCLGAFRLIVNTVPAQVLGEGELRLVRREAVLIDVASAPFGFSLESAEKLGLKAARESGLPGRYCSRTAGCVLLDAALRAFEREGLR